MKIFVIHYDKLIRRKENMLRQLKENNIDAEFISNKGRDVLTIDDKTPFNGLSDSEISLFLHHTECFKKIIEDETNDFALILEDDALFNNSFYETLKKYILHLPNDWDMFFIGDGAGLHVPNNILQKNKKCNIFRGYSSRCTDSYLISKNCALKFMNIINNENFSCNLPIDHWFNLIMKAENLKVLWAEPTIVTQGTENGIFKSSLR
jgi:glycosyl transferase family 25